MVVARLFVHGSHCEIDAVVQHVLPKVNDGIAW